MCETPTSAVPDCVSSVQVASGRPCTTQEISNFYRLHIQTSYVAHIVFRQMSDWDLAVGVKVSSSPLTSIYTVVNLYL
jgi:hypothetical protein